MRFSIRDLLWATLVVAMGLGWWVSYRAVDAKQRAAVHQANRLRETLGDAKMWNDLKQNHLGIWTQRLADNVRNRYGIELTEADVRTHFDDGVNWTILDEPPVR